MLRNNTPISYCVVVLFLIRVATDPIYCWHFYIWELLFGYAKRCKCNCTSYRCTYFNGVITWLPFFTKVYQLTGQPCTFVITGNGFNFYLLVFANCRYFQLAIILLHSALKYGGSNSIRTTFLGLNQILSSNN